MALTQGDLDYMFGTGNKRESGRCSVMKRTTATVMLSGLLVGCPVAPPVPSNPFVSQGESFEVKVVGPADSKFTPLPSFARGLPPCGLDDVHSEDRFPIVLQEHVPFGSTSQPYYQFACPLDFPAPASALPGSSLAHVLPYVCIGVDASFKVDADCELGRFVALYSPADIRDLYEEGPDPSNQFTLLRMLTFGAGKVTCANVKERYPGSSPDTNEGICADQWQVTFAKR